MNDATKTTTSPQQAISSSHASTAASPAPSPASEAARSALAVDAAEAALAAAEDALLAWSFAVARREAGRSRVKLALIAEVERGVGEARHLRSRTKAIDLALRLVP